MTAQVLSLTVVKEKHPYLDLCGEIFASLSCLSEALSHKRFWSLTETNDFPGTVSVDGMDLLNLTALAVWLSGKDASLRKSGQIILNYVRVLLGQGIVEASKRELAIDEAALAKAKSTTSLL